jgi:hypothetical protein
MSYTLCLPLPFALAFICSLYNDGQILRIAARKHIHYVLPSVSLILKTMTEQRVWKAFKLNEMYKFTQAHENPEPSFSFLLFRHPKSRWNR